MDSKPETMGGEGGGDIRSTYINKQSQINTKKSEEINRNEIRNQEITRKISEFSNQKSLEIA